MKEEKDFEENIIVEDYDEEEVVDDELEQQEVVKEVDDSKDGVLVQSEAPISVAADAAAPSSSLSYPREKMKQKRTMTQKVPLQQKELHTHLPQLLQ